MRADVARVEDRLREEVRVDFPFVGEILQGLIEAGGKRLRPLLLLLAARPFNYVFERLLPAAVGVDLVQPASLIPDNRVDKATLRPGGPTLDALIHPGRGILLGGYCFARSAMMGAATQTPRVVQVFASGLAHICAGEL